jgi:hypothetical protein
MNTLVKVLSILIVLSMIRLVSASESGLLLGLRSGANYDTNATLYSPEKMGKNSQQASSYRTFWIRAKNGAIELAAEKTNLLVPREDGVWRVDVKHSAYNDFVEDFVWINPAPDPDAIPNPFLAGQEGIKAFDALLLVKEQGIEPSVGEYCNGYASRDILFVGNNYLSVGYTRSDICGFMGETMENALQMLSLGELEPVSITELLDSEGSKAFKQAAKSYQNQQGSTEYGDSVSGGLVHNQGRWIIKGHFPTNEGGYTLFDVPFAAPSSLVGYNELFPNWDDIKKRVPDAVDALSAPSKDFLVVLTESGSLLAFTLNGGKISEQPALHILFKQPVAVVMASWAEGLTVSNWTQEIQSLGPKPKQSWFTQADISGLDKADKIVGVVVTANAALNIRQGIGQYTKPMAKVQKGSKVNVLDILGQWYKVQLDDGQVGYAHSDYVKILPKLPYIRPACPIDNCNDGEWQLNKPSTLYAEPSFKADSLGTLEAKQVVRAIKGEVHTLQFGEIEVVKPEIEISDDNQKLTLHQGDRLFDLESVGLGMHVVWYNGELYYLNNGWDSDQVSENVLWGKKVAERKTHWWVKVTVPEKNLSGWIANP